MEERGDRRLCEGQHVVVRTKEGMTGWIHGVASRLPHISNCVFSEQNRGGRRTGGRRRGKKRERERGKERKRERELFSCLVLLCVDKRVRRKRRGIFFGMSSIFKQF